MNNDQVAHLWANKSKPKYTGSNFFFEGDTIYSYGRHFPIARHFKGVVLFTNGSYSSSTAAHKSTVRGACSHLEVFTVPDPTKNPSGKDVRYYADKIKRLALEAAKKRDPSYAIERVNAVVAEAKKFCERFKFSTRFKAPDFTEVREKAKVYASKRKKAEAIKREILEAKCVGIVRDWIAGGSERIPYEHGKTYLRQLYIAEVGFLMETSRGARVPLSEAQKAFRFAMLKRESGWHRNGETFAIGDFQLDAVGSKGVKAGCHYVAWDEIERFAKTQGWM